jgi:hypothetical protein
MHGATVTLLQLTGNAAVTKKKNEMLCALPQVGRLDGELRKIQVRRYQEVKMPFGENVTGRRGWGI